MNLSLSNIDLLQELSKREAMHDFYAYRQYINAERFTKGWLHKNICSELMKFTKDFISGKRPKLVLSMPPQHGKSFAIVDYITWFMSNFRDSKIMYTSASDSLCSRANRNVRRCFAKPLFQELNDCKFIDYSGNYVCNNDLVEMMGYHGQFRTATCGGTIVGEELNLGIIDDPLKGRQAANSKSIRERIWEWFTDDFFTRFSDEAGFIAICTRWHVDDPIGRLIKYFGNRIKVLKFSAIAEKDEENRKEGEPLFPELKSFDFLMERKEIMEKSGKRAYWEALYQQNPRIIGGSLCNPEWIKQVDHVPNIQYRIITVDTAQKKKESNDYTVFSLWGMGDDGRIYLLDMLRKRLEYPELKDRAKAFWSKHHSDSLYNERCPLRAMYVEDKASGTSLIQEIKREGKFPIIAVQRNVDKITRFADCAGYLESGMVGAIRGAPHLNDFLDELESFSADDSHEFDDQIDTLMDAVELMLTSKNKVKIWEDFI